MADPLDALHDKADQILDLQRSNAEQIAALQKAPPPQPAEPDMPLPPAVKCTACGHEPTAGRLMCHRRDCPGRSR